MKLALVLYAAKLLAERPALLRRPQNLGPLVLVAGGAVLLIASQPDLGTALVISFTHGRDARRRGHADPLARRRERWRRRCSS